MKNCQHLGENMENWRVNWETTVFWCLFDFFWGWMLKYVEWQAASERFVCPHLYASLVQAICSPWIARR
jgi:hypothetical protein